MKKIWDFYENMKEVVYVSDMDTYEIEYINQFGLSRLGIKSLDEVKGKPCYQILQKCSSPCSVCTNHKLKPNEFLEWKYTNPMLGNTYNLKDTMIEQDGKRYRLEMAIDISLQEKQEQEVRNYQSKEMMVNEILRDALLESTPEKSMERLLKSLGLALKSERTYVFEEMEDYSLKNTYEWCAEGIMPQKENLQRVPKNVVEIWYEAFQKKENIIIKNMEDIKEEDPELYLYLKPQSIDSLVVSPLIFNDQIIGFYGVDNPPAEFLNHISIIFSILGHFMVSILRRRNLVRRLEALSYYDQLTGALNRHGMNEFIETVNSHMSIGIVYCDLMGLKKINDTMGHLEGDKLILQAYECLSNHFSKNQIFRVGGDEFLVMISGIVQADMQRKVQELKDAMPNEGVSFAIGWVWEPYCNGQIEKLMKEADQKMYEEKKRYYKKYPELQLRRSEINE